MQTTDDDQLLDWVAELSAARPAWDEFSDEPRTSIDRGAQAPPDESGQVSEQPDD